MKMDNENRFPSYDLNGKFEFVPADWVAEVMSFNDRTKELSTGHK